MTAVADASRPTQDRRDAPRPAPPGGGSVVAVGPTSGPVDRTLAGPRAEELSPARVALVAWLWAGVTLACLALVLVGLEPLFQQREQRLLLDQQRAAIERAANEAGGLPGVEVPTKAAAVGTPVGIIEIGNLQVQQVVVEGVGSGTTQAGPGHVPGTAGLGQPGNSVVVGRRATFGAPFADLELLRAGDPIVVTTTQGRSVYRVDAVRVQEVRREPDPGGSAVTSAVVDPTAGPDGLGEGPVPVDVVEGPTDTDQLTLLTSASGLPWNGDQAVVVTARLEGTPFTPTPQGGRTDDQTGLDGDASAWAAVVLGLLAFAAAALGSVWLYRRNSGRTAYLLSVAPLLVTAILLGEAVSRLLPAWS